MYNFKELSHHVGKSTIKHTFKHMFELILNCILDSLSFSTLVDQYSAEWLLLT